MMAAYSWSWEGGPAFASYATLGSVIAHEILHAFDLHHRRLPLDPDLDITFGNQKFLFIIIFCIFMALFLFLHMAILLSFY